VGVGEVPEDPSPPEDPLTTGETLALRCGRWCNCRGEWGERGARLRELSGGESGGERHRRSRSRSLSLSLSLLLLDV